ncbi:MAG: hypothetical protein H0T89_04965 [Deltaproteobacteria bacterium]|nr:hypothetical protein [Deltaproteobacteria bacterium]MDQ3301217.1 hypothetical protein [Myxococcota bacterium]
MAEPTVITGLAYQRSATLEVTGDTLTWRAQRGAAQAENIVTTVHDVKDAHWIESRYSLPGGVLACCGIVWLFTHGVLAGAFAITVGAALFIWRRMHPRQFLVLDVGDRRLVLKVAAASAPLARTLVARIDRAIATGELPETPPSLP